MQNLVSPSKREQKDWGYLEGDTADRWVGERR
jgi:hypothetical protein